MPSHPVFLITESSCIGVGGKCSKFIASFQKSKSFMHNQVAQGTPLKVLSWQTNIAKADCIYLKGI